jgi:hypothetical protein
MKKYIITIIAVLIGVLMTGNAFASTNISFSTTSINVVEGQTFTLVVSVDPNGVKNYTSSINLKYPADLVSVSGFTQDSSWMSVVQPNYDLIDNTNGTLIKTAGYPRGFLNSTTFGTITFTAKKSGSGTIETQNGTLSLGTSNTNLVSGIAQTSLVITPVLPVSTSTATTTEEIIEDKVKVEQIKNANIAGLTETSGVTGTATTSDNNDDLFASVLGSGSNLGYIIGGIILLIAGIAWLVFFLLEKKKKGENQNQ